MKILRSWSCIYSLCRLFSYYHCSITNKLQIVFVPASYFPLLMMMDFPQLGVQICPSCDMVNMPHHSSLLVAKEASCLSLKMRTTYSKNRCVLRTRYRYLVQMISCCRRMGYSVISALFALGLTIELKSQDASLSRSSSTPSPHKIHQLAKKRV